MAFAIVTKGDLGIAGLATQALAAGYSRTDERGADKGGFNLCVAAGYNPYSVVLTINKLEDLAKEQGNPGYGTFFEPSRAGRTFETCYEADQSSSGNRWKVQ